MSDNQGSNPIQELTTRAFLDQTVVPVLLQGLTELAKERPQNAIEFLGNFLLSNKDGLKKEEGGS